MILFASFRQQRNTTKKDSILIKKIDNKALERTYALKEAMGRVRHKVPEDYRLKTLSYEGEVPGRPALS